MGAVQLEFQLKYSGEGRFAEMQEQIASMQESMGKVRRNLFAQVTEMKNLCIALQTENQEIKTMLRKLTNEKVEWLYGQNGSLVDVQKCEEMRR